MENKELSFLDEMAGAGLDAIGTNEQSVAYLSMVQPNSNATEEGAEAGTWRNSATGESYGNLVKAVVLAFRTIWSERSSQSPYNTVGRYTPHSIQVEEQMQKNGYPKLINPKTGNEIKELYVYALILPEHPEAGVLYFNPNVSSMKICRSWNKQLKTQLLKSGAPAPIFGFSWNLAVDLVDNPNQKNSKIAKLVKVQKDSVITEELFTTTVKPSLKGATDAVLQITSGDEDAE